ncbi:MAG: YicC family protein [Tissierellia bacterium]|nr:YicC family protein [Tissierellia bacterium]
MLKSMTGYGQGVFENHSIRIKSEIKSVNNKYFNANIRLPRTLFFMEDDIKKHINKSLSRGKVDVFINVDYLDDTYLDAQTDIALAKTYKNELETIIKELDLDEEVNLRNILLMDSVLRVNTKDLINDKEVYNSVIQSIDEALQNITDMRSKEGYNIYLDLLNKLERINDIVVEVSSLQEQIFNENMETLKSRIEEVLSSFKTELDTDRLNNEIVFYSDKLSIDEELVRLQSHISQFKNILEEDNSVGKKLDFLVQEMNREVNTIGSKSNSSIISEFVIELKSLNEMIREQIQNIE